MAGYSRADHERDLVELEKCDQITSAMVANGKITGMRALELGKELDAMRRKCKARLMMARMSATDKKMNPGLTAEEFLKREVKK